ncbi:MAG: D-arabinono-1,4-lactone oxidase [Actinomycetota bacterium]|nr:D-arabinono-1,4-lactone oxidase [Actinomycetota bacterium]
MSDTIGTDEPAATPAGLAAPSAPRWRNWAGNQTCVPAAIERPASEAALVRIVEEAAARGERVKALGAGHSFTAAACTDGRLVDLSRLGRVLAVDPEAGRATVEAGITLRRLNEELAAHGVALENLGDIDVQTIAGAVSTGTHGTGARFGNLSTQVLGARIVGGSGEVVDCDATTEPEVANAARVGIGALGILSTVTLRVVPAFNLAAVAEPLDVDEVVGELDAHIDGNDHFEFFWFPHSRWALTKTNRRTTEPVAPRSRASAFVNDVVVENLALGALCRVATRVPSATRLIGAAVGAGGRSEYVDRADRVFATDRRVRFLEMEYAIPREAFPAAFAKLRRLIDRLGQPLSFPVECRWVAGDDIPLSPASGRDTAYVAVHVYRGEPYEQYFGGVEEIMAAVGGRPHWGKMHFRTAADLAPAYPRWDEFAAVRSRMDPDGRFANPYTDRVLGPPPHRRLRRTSR